MRNTRIIGVMSGTSLDGLDVVAVDFRNNKRLEWEITASKCFAYTDDWKQKLQNAHQLSATSLLQLDAEYGNYLGKRINEFMLQNKLTHVDYIASHGHTIFHRPQEGYTLQIGHGAHLHKMTKIPVICDFRSQDIALGGQGAPLVPIGDQLLFSSYEACINLGGFANISFQQKAQRIAFDICAVNYVLNHYAQCLGLPFDDQGSIAREHPVDSDMLGRLKHIKFYQKEPPKSLGREWVEKEVFPLLDESQSVEEIIATYTLHAAEQIATILNTHQLKNALCTGGGARNKELMRLIQSKTNCELIIADDELIDYKEALIFALLGWLKINHRTNVLSSVTGALRDSSSGIIYA